MEQNNVSTDEDMPELEQENDDFLARQQEYMLRFHNLLQEYPTRWQHVSMGTIRPNKYITISPRRDTTR